MTNEWAVYGLKDNTGAARVWMHSSEHMGEIDDNSAKLVVLACTHLGGWATWDDYLLLLETVGQQAERVLRFDGTIIVFQTDAMIDGKIMPRGPLLLDNLSKGWGHLQWELLDYKIWKRLNANLRQPPWSHVYVMRPPADEGYTARRPNPSNKEYFQGVWDLPARTGGKLNSWPVSLCRLLIETFTEPGDLVVDPFCGSGILLSTAASLGRRGVGYEIDEELIPVITKELASPPRLTGLDGNPL